MVRVGGFGKSALAVGAAVAAAGSAPAPVRSETAASGIVRATITYSIPPGYASYDVRLAVDRAGKRVFEKRVPPYTRKLDQIRPVAVHGGKAVHVRDLDGDGEPEILVDLFWGGAHCCWYSRIYRWIAARRTYASRAQFWGNFAYRLADLERDRRWEFVSADNRFAYAFTSFADSSWPIRIWTYRAGRLVHTTRAYAAVVARDAADQWRRYRARRGRLPVRGFIAAWAADQCLLGRCDAAFGRLQTLKATFSGPIDRQTSGPPGRFLRDLRAFLRETGYVPG